MRNDVSSEPAADNAGFGLSVRWSLQGADPETPQRLREYVVGTSMAKFMFLEGLSMKLWRMQPGEWFEGVYVFSTPQARDRFREQFEASAADAPGSQIVGSAPEIIEDYEVVAFVEGPAGLSRGAGPGA